MSAIKKYMYTVCNYQFYFPWVGVFNLLERYQARIHQCIWQSGTWRMNITEFQEDFGGCTRIKNVSTCCWCHQSQSTVKNFTDLFRSVALIHALNFPKVWIYSTCSVTQHLTTFENMCDASESPVNLKSRNYLFNSKHTESILAVV